MNHSTSPLVRILVLLILSAPAFFLAACNDLSVDPYSQIPADQFFQNEEEITAALAPLYAQLRDLTGAWHNLQQVSTDENIVPTRGTDWGDGGAWLQLHRQNWTAQLGFLNDAWVASSTGIARANGLLANLEVAEAANKDAIVAEVRALRAFYYFTLLDLFGRVPIVGDEEGEFLPDPDNPPATEDRATVFAFVESELLAVRDQLDPQPAQTGRLGRDGVDAILANLYLNAEVFTANVTAGGLSGGTARWNDAFTYADGLINSGRYTLANDFFSLFTPDNENNPEHIFVLQHQSVQGLGVNFQNRALHYNSTEVGAWNGFSTLAETYNAFDENDPRRDIFLIGRQMNLITGELIDNRQGEPLFFTLDFQKRTDPAVEDVTDASEGAGVRINKFPPDASEVNGNHGNDYAFFRLGEMYLIRAEAAFEMGNAGQALDDLNTLRNRVGAPMLTSVDRETILKERLFEMTYEARRRQDLIRSDESIPFSTGGGNLFTRPWAFKPQTEPFRVVYPIPQPQLNANPSLTQNPGY